MPCDIGVYLYESTRLSRSLYQYHFVKRSFIAVLVLTARICMRYGGKREIKTSSVFLVCSDASLVQAFEMESGK